MFILMTNSKYLRFILFQIIPEKLFNILKYENLIILNRAL